MLAIVKVWVLKWIKNKYRKVVYEKIPLNYFSSIVSSKFF